MGKSLFDGYPVPLTKGHCQNSDGDFHQETGGPGEI